MKILDTESGMVHTYGTNCHDSLVLSDDGRTLEYYNLQNGDGSAYGSYRFVTDEDVIPEEDETLEDVFYANIGGFTPEFSLVNPIKRIAMSEVLDVGFRKGKATKKEKGRAEFAKEIYKYIQEWEECQSRKNSEG